jgi:hypothetical protein
LKNFDTRRAKPLHALLIVAAVLLYPSIVSAIDLGDRITLNGFYNLDLSYSDSPGAVILTRDALILLDEGDNTADASLVGAQLDITLTDELSFTLQAIATGHSEREYKPSVEWAYLSYDSGHDLHLRAGQLIVPLLQGTELRHVGFSRLWTSPLVPNSGAAGFDTYDALEAIKTLSVGNYSLTVQAGVGRADHHQDFVDNNHLLLLSGKLEHDDSWVNLALMQADYDVDTETGVDIRDGATALLASMETELLFGNTVLNAGYVVGDAEANPDDQLAYLSLGYRLPRTTPYLLLMQREMEFDAAEQRPASAPTLPPPTAPPLRDGSHKTRITALGMRHDLGDSWALKLQWDYWQMDDDSQASGAIDLDGNLFTIAIEGVF